YPVRTYIAQRRDIAELREEKARVEAERQRLLEESRRVGDPNWVRRTAKERLHYCGVGERCFVVMDPDPGEGQTAAEQPRQQPPSRRVGGPYGGRRPAKARLHSCGVGERCCVVVDPDRGEAQTPAEKPRQTQTWSQPPESPPRDRRSGPAGTADICR